jgi:AmmeMemoRadiSam system protein A
MKRYQELLKLARESIISELEKREAKIGEDIKNKYNKKQACFVTITINGELRGCIGSIEPRQELWKDVLENSRNAAFSDSRFEELTKDELGKIKIEISVLTLPSEISFEDSEELKKKIKGKGVILQSGFYSATYLPQVWDELARENDFLDSLCTKAGLNPNIWREGPKSKLRVWTYLVEKVSE